ncbi:hypothetical protein TKK_0002352 [Trichogramma kaykai]|uniref:Uncharacterized protein n=1 Tax=Trichogramma kaykai TaxID=54128 RepID=A0ABD2XBF9_9HYME
MTPAERIIVRHYASNLNCLTNKNVTLGQLQQFNNSVRTSLRDELNMKMTDEEISRKMQHLKDIFIEADSLIKANRNLTFLQKSIYEALYFLKPYIAINSSINQKEQSKKSRIQSSSAAATEEIEKYWRITKNKYKNDLAAQLNSKIMEYQDTRVQRRVLSIILESIQMYIEKSHH